MCSMCTGATSGDESHPGPPSDQGGELPWIPVCESCEVELDSPADRVMVHGMWLCKKKCGSNYTYLCKTARAGGYNDSLEEFKNKQPKAFQCKLFDLINTLNSNSNKRQNRGKWERAHAIALLEEIASHKKV